MDENLKKLIASSLCICSYVCIYAYIYMIRINVATQFSVVVYIMKEINNMGMMCRSEIHFYIKNLPIGIVNGYLVYYSILCNYIPKDGSFTFKHI